MKLEKKPLIWLLVFILVFGGYFYIQQMKEESANNTAEPQNAVNVIDTGNSGNTVSPQNTAENSGQNSSVPVNTQNNSANSPDNASQNSSASSNNNAGNSAQNNTNTGQEGPVYYTSDVLDRLTGTEIFNKSAIEHIFIGSVNSSGNGSGYHYAMISDAKGKIVEGTKSKPDKNGLYTANVEVDGHPKSNYSTFYPDDWSPQQIVDAIAAAREDALKTGKMSGDYHVGYYNGIQINLYLDGKDRVVTAFPIYNKGR